ncbi:chitin biosynthesis protein CHS5 [Plectosphaerella plurivora]|uniref:Chitin biosynthesis protein CHS5 n=1 Tax=Plectosphaerella plurivora TaxID=936078 RepID=A0A9P8V084_9PEZI|nr:chitin biosynthesis protein CHS5 [Plectosphaerella plurivora]
MLVSLTVGKVDAGVTVLLTPDKRLIEFPSILLPPNISSGSIVDITVGRNSTAETKAQHDFGDLQERIFDAFGASEPTVPVLRCRNATQTSVVLEWDPVELATAELLSLSLFRNGQKAGNIPKPLSMHSTKISGLAVDTEYTFHLVLRTTAGTYTSEKVAVRTHKLTDLSGITITTGIMPHHIKEELDTAVARIGAKIVDGVRIDTTHFVTTEGRGIAWEKAVENNIPVVRPEWVDACEKSGRILGVTKFYLDAVRPGPPTPNDPSSSQKDLPAPPPDHSRSQSQSQSRSPPQPQVPTQPQPSVQPPPQNGDGASASPAAASTSGDDKQESSDEEDEDKAAEQKTRAPEQDEQKMRLEDKEEQQNLALRPSGSKPESDASDSGKGDEDNPEPPVSSSRASFQNVEL